MERVWIGAAIAVAVAGCARPTVDDSPALFAGESDQVERLVPADVPDTGAAVERVLRERAFAPVAKDRDGLGGDLVARGPGRTVFVRIRKLDDDRTRIRVRMEPPDRGEAGHLQEAFARELGLGEAKGGLLGGNSEKVRVGRSLDESVRAVRETFRALKIEETGATQDEREAELRGRRFDSTAVKARLTSDDPGATEATFIAGSRKSEAHRALARQLKREFERRTP